MDPKTGSSLLIHGARVVADGRVETADVWIADGKIARIGSCRGKPHERRIEAAGLTLMPGVIDSHVHFREPGMEWKEDFASGSRAAAAGGVTTIFDMPNTTPPTVTAETLEAKRKLAAAKSLVNYGFFIGATPENLAVLNSVPNVCGIKIYMGSSTGNLLVEDPQDLERIFADGRRLIAVHAEDEQIIRRNRTRYQGTADARVHGQIRSPEAAFKATRAAVLLAQRYRRRLHLLHLSTREEVEFLAAEKAGGFITAEVTPQHLLLSAPSVYDNLASFALVNPPIRSGEHARALERALKDGLIDTIASDHAPHVYEEKGQPYGLAPSGMPGVETLLPLMLNQAATGQCSLPDVVGWLCRRPAEIFGVRGKGRIAPGYDADCVLVDMDRSRTVDNASVHTRAGWSPYHGWTLKGWPVLTMVHGAIVYQEGEFIDGHPGREIEMDAPWEKS